MRMSQECWSKWMANEWRRPWQVGLLVIPDWNGECEASLNHGLVKVVPSSFAFDRYVKPGG